MKKFLLAFVLTFALILFSFTVLFVKGIKTDIQFLSEQIALSFQLNEEVQAKRFDLTIEAFTIMFEYLEKIDQSNQYIIDQNREREYKQENTKTTSQTKPTYKELKSHTVFIIGCSGEKDIKSDMSYNLGDEDMCWSGTGVVLKTVNNKTYILTNNHVAGKDEKNVKLYVENGREKIQAEVVKNHEYEDVAVIKIEGELIGKVAIPGISMATIQDPVYVVGNPLGVKYVYSEGVVAGYEDTSMLIQMPLIYGNSGSGVFDKNGNLVGLVFALEGYRGWMGIPQARITHSLIVDSITIRPFLKSLGLL
jgi:S1-C subfamily serine protease